MFDIGEQGCIASTQAIKSANIIIPCRVLSSAPEYKSGGEITVTSHANMNTRIA